MNRKETKSSHSFLETVSLLEARGLCQLVLFGLWLVETRRDGESKENCAAEIIELKFTAREGDLHVSRARLKTMTSLGEPLLHPNPACEGEAGATTLIPNSCRF